MEYQKNKKPTRNVMVLMILIAFFSLFLTSCGDDTEANSSDFGITLTLKNQHGEKVTIFNETDLITFELTIQNRTSTTQTLTFPSGYQHDFILYDTRGEKAWVWSSDKVFTQSLTEITIEANESFTVSQTWNQEIDPGVLIEAGNYKAEGRLNADVRDNTSLRIDIIIQ